MNTKLQLSTSNSKLGNIPNTSLLAGRDCLNAKACIKQCYAVPIIKQYKNVRTAWTNNGDILRADPSSYFDQVRAFFDKKRTLPELYRIHVSGDFISQKHVDGWAQIAREYPSIKFLAYTKSYSLNYTKRPSNLEIVFSVFPATVIKGNKIATDNGEFYTIDKGVRFAWLEDKEGVEKRIPSNAYNCPAVKDKTIKCADCKACWSLSSNSNDVKFQEH